MKKPQLCLALSASLALLQANLLPALSEPASPSIWQKLSTSSVSKPVVKSGSPTVIKVRNTSVARTTSTAHGIADANDGFAMLFLGGKKEAGSSSGSAPAAALTIHPALPLNSEQPVATSVEEQPTLVAMNETPNTASDATASAAPSPAKQLLAQLAPDQIVAQAGPMDSNPASATPIPPVVSGTVDLEEFKTSNVIDLKVSQSRTFRMKNKIVRTSISDPAIAEPVVVAENQLVLLGKAPGGATLVIWDDAGNSIAVDLRVTRDYSSLQATLREIDPRIIVRPFTVGGSDRVILLGDVDHPESVIRAFSASNAFMDDRGINILASNSRLVDKRVGEQGQGGGGGQTGGQTGALAQLSQVDKYVFFSNMNNNVGKAQSMVSDGGRVTSLIRVRKTPLIVLHCTFMEMNTASVRELGVQLGVNFTSSTFGFGIGGNNTSGTGNILTTSGPGLSSLAATNGAPQVPLQAGGVVQPVNFTSINSNPVVLNPLSNTPIVQNNPVSAIGQGVLNSPPVLLGQSFLFGAPGGATFGANGLANLFSAVSNFNHNGRARWSLNPTVNGIISHSRARVLAEPTLVTISGERAAFLAGGEIPIVQSLATAGTAQQSVVFEPFGLRLNMIPVLLENGSINLEVAPEERLLSNQNGINLTLVGFIPGFTTRKMQTIVEMKPGQELFISGLVTANSGRELDKTPILGEVPVLGALYRSKAFNKNESELVVAVRPEIILPGTPGQLKLPEEISRVEGPRDTNLLQVEPTVVDERYMTSGRADRSQRIPGILPPGAPVPDNQ